MNNRNRIKIILVSMIILLAARTLSAQTREQLAEEKQLQELYPGYRGVSPDYLHAGKEAIEKFQDLKYGLRIHWGIYSIWEVEASLLLSGNIGGPERKFDNAERAEYYRLANKFNPTQFDPNEWMELFNELGFTFFTITTKHCDGFSLFDTKTKVKKCWDWFAEGGPRIIDCDTSFSIMDTPYKKDIIKQLADAAHKHGLKIDLYFSHPDWFDADQRFDLWHPLKGTPICDSYNKETDPVSYARFMKRHRRQITELLTNYGKIDMMCLDMGFPEWAQQDMIETVKEVRKIQPQVMFRRRGINEYGDYTTPERWYPESPDDPKVTMPWLAIDPVGEIFAYEPDGKKYRDHKWLLTTLIKVVSTGGNFSPAIGPDASGKFHPTVIGYLRTVGDWLKVNGQAIYNTRPWLWFKRGDTVRFTRSKDNNYVYAIMLKWDGNTLVLDNMKPKDRAKITLLADPNTTLDWNYCYDKLFITGFGSTPTHGEHAWAVKIPIDKSYYDADFIARLNEERPLETVICLDEKSEARTFKGIGALSAGASSRLLIDYPEPYRSDILDYLFKPKFGASLHHLKVEIGGDVSSTDGSEPSHARTRNELENPKPEYYQRGYERWLMAEAKKRNPDIILEGLQWGAPGWIGDGKLYSRDNAEFVAAWVKGVKKYHNLDIDYVGISNERKYDVEYIKLLRKVLDENGLEQTKIDAGDLWLPQEMWDIADDMVKDPELRKAVAVINAHTTEMVDHKTSENARSLGIALWNGEAHAYGGDWKAAGKHAAYNRAYPIGKITKIISWSLISSYHDYLLVPNSGMMKANTPWSGYYDVQPPVWMIAHTNQFVEPGWKYIDSGCALLGNGSVVTLKSPDSNDYSIIIETMGAEESQTVTFKLSEVFSRKDLSFWRSTLKKDLFIKQDDISTKSREFTVTLAPDTICSLTTTCGHQKGQAKNPVPADFVFPLPFSMGFEDCPTGKQPRYFCDQHGVFDVVERPDGGGKCLKQMIPMQGIQWRIFPHPLTIIGDIRWQDYKASIDFMLGDAGNVKFGVRTDNLNLWTGDFTGYFFEIEHLGNWKLSAAGRVLASGKENFGSNRWHTAGLACARDEIKVTLDDKILADVKDDTIKSGVIGIGTGWNHAYFDNFKISKPDSK